MYAAADSSLPAWHRWRGHPSSRRLPGSGGVAPGLGRTGPAGPAAAVSAPLGGRRDDDRAALGAAGGVQPACGCRGARAPTGSAGAPGALPGAPPVGARPTDGEHGRTVAVSVPSALARRVHRAPLGSPGAVGAVGRVGAPAPAPVARVSGGPRPPCSLARGHRADASAGRRAGTLDSGHSGDVPPGLTAGTRRGQDTRVGPAKFNAFRPSPMEDGPPR